MNLSNFLPLKNEYTLAKAEEKVLKETAQEWELSDD